MDIRREPCEGRRPGVVIVHGATAGLGHAIDDSRAIRSSTWTDGPPSVLCQPLCTAHRSREAFVLSGACSLRSSGTILGVSPCQTRSMDR